MDVAEFATPIFKCERRNRVRESSSCRLSQFRSSLSRSMQIEAVVLAESIDCARSRSSCAVAHARDSAGAQIFKVAVT